MHWSERALVNTLAEPTLVALSGETASFLAGGEFPVPVVQNAGSGTVAAASQRLHGRVEAVRREPGLYADGACRWCHQHGRRARSELDRSSASIVVNNLTIPGLQTRRAKTTVEFRDGESFALAGLLRRDFQDTVRQFPILGSLPIIGTLFRSTGFQREETELLMIVTPRLVRPAGRRPPGPTDRAKQPNEADLFLLGRTDTGVPRRSGIRPPARPAVGAAGARIGRNRKPTGLRKGIRPCPISCSRSAAGGSGLGGLRRRSGQRFLRSRFRRDGRLREGGPDHRSGPGLRRGRRPAWVQGDKVAPAVKRYRTDAVKAVETSADHKLHRRRRWPAIRMRRDATHSSGLSS